MEKPKLSIPSQEYRDDLAKSLKDERAKGGGAIKKVLGLDGRSQAQKLLKNEKKTTEYLTAKVEKENADFFKNFKTIEDAFKLFFGGSEMQDELPEEIKNLLRSYQSMAEKKTIIANEDFVLKSNSKYYSPSAAKDVLKKFFKYKFNVDIDDKNWPGVFTDEDRKLRVTLSTDYDFDSNGIIRCTYDLLD